MKQVIAVRTDLLMSVGKIAVQACHASVAAVMLAKANDVERWNFEGQTKIAVEARTLAELNRLKIECEKLGIVHALISDAGQTELAPGTITALAIGPAENRKVDKVAGSIPLLR